MLANGVSSKLVVLAVLWWPYGAAMVSALKECSGCETPNVRTVVFRQIDLVKDCWSDEELALLYARRLLQELIPKRVTCNIPLLLEYVVLVLETARGIACSARAHRLLITAIADAFGGYLQAYGLPQALSRYYEGGVSYCTVQQVSDVQSEFRRLLGTDGGGWTGPVHVRRASCCRVAYRPKPLPRTVCANLVSAVEPQSGGSCGKPAGERSRYAAGGQEMVPLPFLDDALRPHAIAVPFKDRSLYSLFSRNSSDILLRYYSVALTCLGPPTTAACTDTSYGQKIDIFVGSFHEWLTRTVLPRLHDEIWYPGFGGVYTIIQEMETRGLLTQEVSCDESGDEFSLKESERCSDVQTSSPWFNMWLVLSAFLLFWIIVCNLCCLFKYCSRNNENDYPCTPTSSSSGAVINSLVTMYCCEKQDIEGLSQKDSD